MSETILIHYGELGLKGANRGDFEKVLLRQIQIGVGPAGKIRRLSGRLLLEGVPFAEAAPKLAKVFGIANFTPVEVVPAELEAVSAVAISKLQGQEGPFRIRARRATKDLPFTSPEAEREIGARVVEATGLGVRLSGPAAELRVEFYHQRAFVYLASEIQRGPGGLPVGSTGHVMVLLSGGIDSPVAAWRLQRRGARVSLVHFHSYPHTDLYSLRKAELEAQILAGWQGPVRLYSVALAPVQEAIFAACPERLRTLLYRRFMLRIATKLAEREGALALVTGDSLGQVASQTLENLAAVEAAVDMPVFRPLIGMDKEEIMSQAQALGSYEVSILPQQDCCSFLEPAHPATHATAAALDQAEASLAISGLVESALAQAELMVIDELSGVPA